MRKIWIVVVLSILPSRLALSQDYMRGEVFTGYSYSSTNMNGLVPARQSLNGWESSLTTSVNRWLAGEADFGGVYQTLKVLNFPGASVPVPVALHDYTILAGPRVNHGHFFVHALAGLDHLSGSGTGFSASQNKFGGAVGGGLEWNVSRIFGLRTSADYMFTRHNLFGGPALLQNDLRASVGVVYRFGGSNAPESRPPSPRASTPKPTHSQPAQVKREPAAVQRQPAVQPGQAQIALLGITVSNGQVGAKVTYVSPSNVAQLAGVNEGDVINSIDGKPIRNIGDLVAALADVAPGSTIRLGYLIKGYWQTESIIALPRSH
jgi:opacity protein-like surface antigen